MKYVMKFLCAFAIIFFVSSCASPGSGCYDFGDDFNAKNNADLEHIEIVSIGKKINDSQEVLTICSE